MLMWRNLSLLRFNIKSKLLNCILSFFGYAELYITGYFVGVLNLDSFNDSLRFFRRYQSAEVENSFFNKENIRLDLFHDISAVLLAG